MAESSMLGDVSPTVIEDNKVAIHATTDQPEISGQVAPQELNDTNNDTTANGHSTSSNPSVAPKDTPKESAIIPEPDTKGKTVEKAMTKKTETPATTTTVTKPASTKATGSAASIGKPGGITSTLRKTFSSSTSSVRPPAPKPTSSLSSSMSKAPISTTTVKKTPSTTSNTSVAKSAPLTTTSSSAAITSAPTRRASMALAASKPLSSSTSSRPPSVTSTGKATSTTATTRASVTSPPASGESLRSSVGSGAAKPRASVSDGVLPRKSAPRASLSGVRTPTSTTSGMRPLRTAGAASISSMQDVKEESNVVQELESKYKEAMSSLESNLEKIKQLEAQIESTKATLVSVEIERDEKQRELEALKTSKEALEEDLMAAQQGLETHKGDKELSESQLLKVKDELKAIQEANVTQIELVSTLQEQIKVVNAELVAAKEAKIASESLHKKALEAEVTQLEALRAAQANLETIKAESDALAEVQRKVQAEASERIAILETQAQTAGHLTTEVEQLKHEKEDIEARLSEHEIEILELRENVEKATDDKEKTSARLKLLEKELEAVNTANAAAARAAEAKEAEHSAVLANMQELETQLATALESQAASQAALAAKEEEHAQKLAEVQQLHKETNKSITVELERVKLELEGQETQYAKKLDGVKAEHADLLEQAFNRAKAEAGEEHSLELQRLRAQSQATIEQLRQAHQASLDDTRASHEETLAEKVNSLEKHISALSLDLKATQDDLAKAKAGLEAALALEGTLRTQIEQKDAEFAAAKLPEDRSEEVIRLTKELSNAKDDLLNITEAFTASKESFKQISANHQVELEEGAKGRAEEVTRLRTAHAEEMATFRLESDKHTSHISELEVELATLKAAVEAQPAAAPATPRKDANGSATGVSKEELQQMHEAHNLKLYELEKAHEQTVQALAEKLEAATVLAAEHRAHADRLEMEISFAEQASEENEDELKQLRDEVEHLKTQLSETTSSGP